jgi:hypothetical protein
MKTTTEVMIEWYDKSLEILVVILLLPFTMPLVPFWIAAKIYTKWFQKESN